MVTNEQIAEYVFWRLIEELQRDPGSSDEFSRVDDHGDGTLTITVDKWGGEALDEPAVFSVHFEKRPF